jgi:Fe-S-cluster-containing dehydrogenase component
VKPDAELNRIRRRDERKYELSRRQFMQLVAASMAVSFASGCEPDQPERILPYARSPADITPGTSTHYATSILFDGFASGLIVETREGRPIKVEGNPAHPASLGAASSFHQAAVLQLYDPDRQSPVLHARQPATWAALLDVLQRARTDLGAGLRLVLEPTSSPLVHALLAEIKQRHPHCKVTFYSPLPNQVPLAASERLFGTALAPHYEFSKADVVVALDSDVLTTPHQLRYARDFAARRHLTKPSDHMNRLYAVESAMSVTGSMADHRLRRPSGRIAPLCAALAGALLPEHKAFEPAIDAQERRFVAALARDLKQCSAGRSLVLAGERQSADVHVLCYAINAALGNLGETLRFTPPAEPGGAGDQDLVSLTREMQAGLVDTLIVLGPNPSYDAPADLEWSRAMTQVKHSVYCGMYANETARDAAWFGPLAHPFESWGDGRAYDGTLSFTQPLIRTMFGGKTLSELLAAIADRPADGDHARLRVRFGEAFGEGLTLAMSAAERKQRAQPAVNAAWEAALAQGFVPNSAFAGVTPTLRGAEVTSAFSALAAQPRAAGLEINFLKSPTLHDGRFANVSWLLELPEPITKLTWDNAVLMSPATARRLALPVAQPDDDAHPMLELTRAGRKIRAPLLCLPSHADESVTIWLGYGRTGAERLAHGVGVDAYRLRTLGAEHFASDLQVHAQTDRYPLAISQPHRDMHGRPLALSATLADYRSSPDFTAEMKGPLPSFFPDTKLAGPQWAMSIDLGMCTGCSACVVACQAENNILVVGKDQVRRGRIMHWIRLDVYDAHGTEERTLHQPMLCQHCEKAPCEVVCPVNATEHSPDGLNEMVYNRCVGTRFCSNNCPYKVRRFNWYNWSEHEAANRGSVELQRNPDVSVRERGVMEKCSYCVQRIREAEINARIDGHRELRPGEVVTACQQACPSHAISFDSLSHEATPMLQWRMQDRSYAVLHETGAQPRTMYLARIDNPNPELA